MGDEAATQTFSVAVFSQTSTAGSLIIWPHFKNILPALRTLQFVYFSEHAPSRPINSAGAFKKTPANRI